MAIDDDSWQEQLLRVILERIHYFTDDGDEQVCLGVWWLQGGKFRVESGVEEIWGSHR